MADQRDVQQLIQGLTPSGVNNGNPNTAYNNSPIPVMDAFGNWSRPQVSPAASISFNRAASSLPASTPLNLPRLPSGILGSTPVPGGGVVPPAGPVDPLNPWTPPTQVGGGTATPPSAVSPPASLGGQSGNQTLPGNNLGNVPPLGSFQGNLNTGGTGGGSSSSGFGLWDISPALAQQLGINQGGGMDWQQFLDVVSEPFARGDFWNAQTNTWNPEAFAQAGGGLLGGEFGRMLAGALVDNPDAMRNEFGGDILRNAAEFRGELRDQMDATARADIQNYLASIGLGKADVPPTAQAAFNRGWSAGQVAQTFGSQAAQNAIRSNPYSVDVGTRLAAGVGKGGAGVITGDAARDMFDSMKAGSFGQKQTGGDLLGRLYER